MLDCERAPGDWDSNCQTRRPSVSGVRWAGRRKRRRFGGATPSGPKSISHELILVLCYLAELTLSKTLLSLGIYLSYNMSL